VPASEVRAKVPELSVEEPAAEVPAQPPEPIRIEILGCALEPDVVTNDLGHGSGGTRSADKRATDPQVFGILGFGHAAAWEFPEGGLPQLQAVAPMRWNAVTDDEYQNELFRRFMQGWSSRFRRRMRAIIDGEIEE
jgi:hypothetical protein